MTLPEEKQALRAQVRQRERRLPAAYRARSGEEIAALLLSMDLYRRAETVCCFVGTAREIDTMPVLRDALSAGKRLCVPLCTGPGVMEARQIETPDALSPGAMGILEPDPARCPRVEAEEIGLLVVPCLACDRRGNRLGQGGGYYDRFLKRCPGRAVLLCRERLLLERVPVEAHDRPVPLVLTERGLYEQGTLVKGKRRHEV